VEIQLASHTALAERMLYTWGTLYHASLKKGQTFEDLRPVVAIWLLKEALFPDLDAYHLPFAPYNIRHKRLLSTHQAIHVVQLPKWRAPETRLDEIDRWMYFFTRGQELDLEHLPEMLNTEEMKQAMHVLQDFSESEKNYLLYEQRLEAERVELTWKRSLARREAELAQKDVELKRLAALLRQAGIDPETAQTPT
jgi:predicted transposase/invertase (TIGR01784 family)